MDGQFRIRRARRLAQPWLDWLNLGIGAVLAMSPWLLLSDSYAALLNVFFSGTAVAIAAGIALVSPNVWAQRLNITSGIWLAVAPLVLGYADSAADTLTSLLAGLGVAGFASFQLSLIGGGGRR